VGIPIEQFVIACRIPNFNSFFSGIVDINPTKFLQKVVQLNAVLFCLLNVQSLLQKVVQLNAVLFCLLNVNPFYT
jgi:hypothetical protein